MKTISAWITSPERQILLSAKCGLKTDGLSKDIKFIYTWVSYLLARCRYNNMNCELMLTYDTPALWQTGSRNLTGQKTLPTIWGTYRSLQVYQRSNSQVGHRVLSNFILKIVRQMSDKILPGRSESLHSQIVKL
jgi:hypothetical protein